mmetsp:Transcript_32806/g.80410  ORF Transcript_32806/g.80410 Transcript_32806/m.80410 type:complete len:328 (+) Transcript_32806:85-1068(+)
MASSEIALAAPPRDGITAAQFAPDSNNLLVSSWDKSVAVHDVQTNAQRCAYGHEGPVLAACWALNGATCFSGGLDAQVAMYDVQSGRMAAIGRHDKPVRCLAFSRDHNVLVSGSWDATVRLFDPRQPNAQVGQHQQQSKVFALALSRQRVVVGMNERRVWIWDLRNMNQPEQRRESSLKYQTRCVNCFIDGTGYALSSTEGRVAMEYFDAAPDVQAKKYAFKCHRQVNKGVDQVYPVNAIAFHPVHGTFATGGGDGLVNLWDGQNKKRLCQFRKYPTSIAAMSFNYDGSMLAIASSYTWEEGERDHEPDAVYVRTISDLEAQPKMRR